MSDTSRNDDRLDELRALYTDMQSGDEGPSDEALTALLLGELEGSARDAVVRQLLASPDAVERYRLLKELHQAARPPRRASLPFLSGIAACLAVAVSLLVLWPIDSDLPVVRGGSDAVRPSEWAALDQEPTSLTWGAGGFSAPYRVQMYSQSGALLWESGEVKEPRYTLTEEQRQLLSEDEEFFWVVRSSSGDQRGPYWFRVRREASQ